MAMKIWYSMADLSLDFLWGRGIWSVSSAWLFMQECQRASWDNPRSVLILPINLSYVCDITMHNRANKFWVEIFPSMRSFFQMETLLLFFLSRRKKIQESKFSAWSWAESGVQREWPGAWGLLAERAHPLNTSCVVSIVYMPVHVCVLLSVIPFLLSLRSFFQRGSVLMGEFWLSNQKEKTSQLWITTANTAL